MVATFGIVIGLSLTSDSGTANNLSGVVTLLVGLVSTLAAVASAWISYLAWRHPHG